MLTGYIAVGLNRSSSASARTERVIANIFVDPGSKVGEGRQPAMNRLDLNRYFPDLLQSLNDTLALRRSGVFQPGLPKGIRPGAGAASDPPPCGAV